MKSGLEDLNATRHTAGSRRTSLYDAGRDMAIRSKDGSDRPSVVEARHDHFSVEIRTRPGAFAAALEVVRRDAASDRRTYKRNAPLIAPTLRLGLREIHDLHEFARHAT
jgi:hypothetical protein